MFINLQHQQNTNDSQYGGRIDVYFVNYRIRLSEPYVIFPKMKKKLNIFWGLLKRAGINWNQNNPWAQSATIAYYALFSLPSLLIIVVSTAGYFFGQEAVQGKITHEIGNYIGEGAAKAIEDIIVNAAFTNTSSLIVIFGIAVLLVGATGVFFQLKLSLNHIWNVTAKKKSFLRMLINRAVSFGMVLILGFLLLVSLIISALLAAFGNYLATLVPGFSNVLMQVLNFIISFLVITSLFAAIFKLLPDVKLKWGTVYLGASLTTILFMIGTYLIGFYFGTSNPTSVFGGASAVVLILLWVYYSCLILFYGMEFTVQYALHRHEEIIPNKYAEPEIYQELKGIKNKNGLYIDEKRIMEMLRSDPDISDSK